MSDSPSSSEHCHCNGKFAFTHTPNCTSPSRHPSFCHCIACESALHPNCESSACMNCASDRLDQKIKSLEEQGTTPHVHLKMVCPLEHVIRDNALCKSCKEGGPKHGLPVNGEEILTVFARICPTCQAEHPGAFWVRGEDLLTEKPEI
jgi:hypothetical protein